MDFSNAKNAITQLINSVGVVGKVEKTDGTNFSTKVVVMSMQTDENPNNNYVTHNRKVMYISGKVKSAPENGDAITVKPNLYIVADVKAYAVGEGNNAVFAYRCEVTV